MEWVWVSVFVFLSVAVWAFVKVLHLATAWKILEALEKAQDLQLDSELAQALEKWKAQE